VLEQWQFCVQAGCSALLPFCLVTALPSVAYSFTGYLLTPNIYTCFTGTFIIIHTIVVTFYLCIFISYLFLIDGSKELRSCSPFSIGPQAAIKAAT
jgi:hypothetical protein